MTPFVIPNAMGNPSREAGMLRPTLSMTSLRVR